MSVELTGEGTSSSHYIISGDIEKDVWFKLLEIMAIDGVFVDLDREYTFDLYVIYEDSIIPNEIPIGYDTTVYFNSSIITGEYLYYSEDGRKTQNCVYPKGDKGTILKVKWLNYNNGLYNIYLCDTSNLTISAISNNDQYKIVVSKEDLVYDLNDIQTEYELLFKNVLIFEANGFTIKNSRNFILKCSGSSSNSILIYDLNIIDCYSVKKTIISNSSTHNYNFYRCFFKLYEYLDDSIKSFIGNRMTFYSCNFCLFSNSKIDNNHNYGCYISENTNATFEDCNIYIDYCTSYKNSLAPTYNNCYIYGKMIPYVSTRKEEKWAIGSGYNNIVEIEAIDSSEGDIPPNFSNSAFCNLLGNENFVSTASRAKILTSEEIRNPQKLYDAGIPINPMGISG